MTHFKSNLMIAKTTLAASLVAGTLLVSGAAFASPESTQNGIPVMQGGLAMPVTGEFRAYSNALGTGSMHYAPHATQRHAMAPVTGGLFDPANTDNVSK